jgi:hypothetical protein
LTPLQAIGTVELGNGSRIPLEVSALSSCRGFGWAVVASTVLSPLVSGSARADEGGGLVGWVESTHGKRGGYILAKAPEEIRMGQVVRRFDTLLAPIDCVSITHYEKCSQEAVCRFRRVFLQIRNETAHLMDHATLASIHAGQPVLQTEVFDEALIGGAGI